MNALKNILLRRTNTIITARTLRSGSVRSLQTRSSNKIQKSSTIFSTISKQKTNIIVPFSTTNIRSEFFWKRIKQFMGMDDPDMRSVKEEEEFERKFAAYPQFELYKQARTAQQRLQFQKAEDLLVQALNIKVEDKNIEELLPLVRKVSFFRILNLDVMRVDPKVLRDEMLTHLEEYDPGNPNLWIGFIKLLIEANQIDDAIAAVQKFRKLDMKWDNTVLANLAYLEGNIMESLGKDEEASRFYDDALALEFSPVYDDAKHHERITMSGSYYEDIETGRFVTDDKMILNKELPKLLYSVHNEPDSLKTIRYCSEGITKYNPQKGLIQACLAVIYGAWKKFKLYYVAMFFFALVSSSTAVTYPKILAKIVDLPYSQPSEELTSNFYFAIPIMFCIFCEYYCTVLIAKDHLLHCHPWRYFGLLKTYLLPVDWHNRHSSGSTGSKVEQGGSAIWVLLNSCGGQDLFLSLTVLVSVLYSSIREAPGLWWLFILPCPAYLLLNEYMGYVGSTFDYVMSCTNVDYDSKKIQKAQEITSFYNRKAAQYLYDGLANVKVVKAFGREYYETAQYAARWSSFHKSEYDTEVLNFNRMLIQSFFDLFMRIVLLYYLFINITAGRMTVGSIAMLMSYQGMIFGPLSMLSGIFASIKRQTQRSKDLMDILHESDPLRDSNRPIDIKHLKHDIKLDNVMFTYLSEPGIRPALDDCTLTLKAGTTTALVGRSGAGKSTVISLLLRFYDPTTGRILWDGEDLRNFSRKSLHQRVAVVPQDVLIFNRSIRENIAYGDPDLPLSVVMEAAKKAHIHDFIMTLPQQYDSIIGENGIQLSGGQKQRVSIARALALDPSLILFDESTSHLDSESELAIQESIASLHHEITQVIVAHRFSTILHADQIVVLDEGKIIGVGTHHELVRANPVYQKLYTLQFKDDDKDKSN